MNEFKIPKSEQDNVMCQPVSREPLSETQIQKALMAYLQCSASELESYSPKLMDGYTADVQRILDAVFP